MLLFRKQVLRKPPKQAEEDMLAEIAHNRSVALRNWDPLFVAEAEARRKPPPDVTVGNAKAEPSFMSAKRQLKF